MSNFTESEQSKKMWEEIADDWDERMGDTDNQFHREIIRPSTLKLLDPKKDDFILDIACGNGNFSRCLADLGAKVIAFDYSTKMIKYAKMRCKDYISNIDFILADATKYDDLMALKTDKPFDKAVSNMAIMDIVDIEPLFKAVYDLLSPNGIFVFSSVHPCFQTPNMQKIVEINDDTSENNVRMGIKTYKYIKPCIHQASVLAENNKRVLQYHMPLSILMNMCFKAGFVIDGMEEPVFKRSDTNSRLLEKMLFDWYEIPPSIIIRLKKQG